MRDLYSNWCSRETSWASCQVHNLSTVGVTYIPGKPLSDVSLIVLQWGNLHCRKAPAQVVKCIIVTVGITCILGKFKCGQLLNLCVILCSRVAPGQCELILHLGVDRGVIA